MKRLRTVLFSPADPPVEATPIERAPVATRPRERRPPHRGRPSARGGLPILALLGWLATFLPGPTLAAQTHALPPSDALSVPTGTAAWIAFADPSATTAALDEWVSALDLAPATQLLFGLGRIALWRATGHRRPSDAVAAALPGATLVGVWVPDGGTAAAEAAPVPFALVHGADTVPEALSDREGLRAEGLGDGRILIAPDRGWARVFTALDGATAAVPLPSDRLLEAHADLRVLRRVLPALSRPSSTLDPAARFLIGPWVEILTAANSIDIECTIRGPAIDVRARIDAGLGSLPSRRFVTAPDGDRSIVPHGPPGAFVSMVLARDPAAFLAARDELLLQGQAAQVSGGLSIADSLAAGSFVDDLLRPLDGPWRLHLTPPLRADDTFLDPQAFDTPLHLPGLLVTAPIRTAAAVEEQDAEEDGARPVRRLRDQAYRTLGKFAFAASAERRRNGEPGFRARAERGDHGPARLVLHPDPWRGPAPAPASARITPSLVVTDTAIALASTDADLCAWLAAAPTRPDAAPPDPAAERDEALLHDAIRIDADGLLALGEANRRILEFNQIVDEGKTPNEAHRNISILLDVVDALATLTIDLIAHEDRASIEIQLEAKR
jgi:hypothetical protein